ncbi:dimethylamine monooxygenase subunit DmmA family protein [uncultured Mycolicibacterium sp.]|uniref:dimethylamine monooxygenase subunit DmmA family protein n=1 Tax=uncultured Mycolicibacterium sp. TaxID=2320817 RepID=UPI00262192F1|nr:dimethylamine monooxygenase subunit DmmA family protein [uncultured Mycolicibacterium sp.]
MTAAAPEVVPPQIPSLPSWPSAPDPVDTAAASFLVVAVGSAPGVADVAADWVRQAEASGPTRLLTLDSMTSGTDRAALADALDRLRTGVRIMVVGGQYDVLRALTAARDHGAIPAELSAFVVHTDDAPIYCAHCRGTYRVEAGPGDETPCPGCGRTLEIHHHFAAALGSFLASDARARELAE